MRLDSVVANSYANTNIWIKGQIYADKFPIYRSWYEQQLKLDMGNTMSPRGVERLLGVLKWL